MNETLFYLLGIALVAAAVIVAFLGLRTDRFPASRSVMVAGTALFAALVVATAAFAWLNAEDEQEHREAELAESAAENVAEGDEGEAAEEVGSGVAADEAAEETGATAAVDGAQVFETAGCGGCHTLADAGSTGATGPDLDEALAGQSPAQIEESIVDPNATIAQGFTADVMPQTYGDDLAPEELEALVAYLSESTGSGG